MSLIRMCLHTWRVESLDRPVACVLSEGHAHNHQSRTDAFTGGIFTTPTMAEFEAEWPVTMAERRASDERCEGAQ